MPAPGQSTFDGNPNANPPTTTGYRPGLSDFNGAALTDDPVMPPDPATMPTSALFNTYDYLLTSIGKVMPVGSFGLIPGSPPSIKWAFTAALNLVASSTFTPTRNGAGDYTVAWPANTFPLQGDPKVHLNVQLGAHNYSAGAVYVTNGVRITTTQDGVLTDLAFCVDLF